MSIPLKDFARTVRHFGRELDDLFGEIGYVRVHALGEAREALARVGAFRRALKRARDTGIALTPDECGRILAADASFALAYHQTRQPLHGRGSRGGRRAPSIRGKTA